VNKGNWTYDVGDSLVHSDTIDVPLTNFNCSFANNTIGFNPDGSATGTGNLTCYRSNGHSFNIAVTAGSGRSRLEFYN
jgi:hypothetical protein